MPSLIERLLGRPEPVAKAVTGPGAFAMETGVPLKSLSGTPQKIARKAMDTYHSNEWVNAAESLIDNKFGTVAWHLEDDKGQEVKEDDQNPVRQRVLGLLRRPNPVWSRTLLWKLTCRHMGLPGRGFWYLDALDPEGLPQGFYSTSPDRMWPATDRAGNLIGWVMDADRPDGREPVPFSLEEIIQFPLDPPDAGYLGTGKVESAWRKILLTTHTDEYGAQSFASGGRLPGIYFPREVGYVENQEKFTEWVRQMRDAQDGGVRKQNLLKFPVDYTPTSAKPGEMQLPDMSKLARDDILSIWAVPPSQLGIVATRGMNSGETQKYEEASLWQNAIEPRLSIFVDLLQTRVLDKVGLTLVLETPSFDDDLPLYEMAQRARYVPMSINKRLALIGMDPLDEKVYGAELGNTIHLDKSLVQVFPEPEVPEPLEPFAGRDNGNAGADDDTETPETDMSAKAKLHFDKVRSRVEAKYEPQIREAIGKALAEQRADLKTRITERAAHIATKPGDVTVWWNERREYERLRDALEPTVLAIAADVTRTTSATFFRPVKADSLVDRVLDYVRNKVGQRIRGINETTRDKIRDLVGDGIQRGDSPAVLGDSIEAATAFNESRAEMIARTETMLAYNDAAIGTYSDFGVEEVQAIDGDDDAQCAIRNGSVFSIAEASGIADHPNGTLDWVPIVKAKVDSKAVINRIVIERDHTGRVVGLRT